MKTHSLSSTVWHPFTQHAFESKMKKIVKTQDAYLFDEDGNKIIDAISSWWVVTHGHRHPKIIDAISFTGKNLDQIIFAEYTHEPAERLAEELIKVAPKNLKHVFYSDSGSTCVEVAIKMALGFFKNNETLSHGSFRLTAGSRRTRIVVMEHSYHGDTIGTMSVGERGVFNKVYEPCLFDVDCLPFPSEGYEQNTLDAFENFCKKGEVAALLVEPLVLGAGGFKIYSTHVLFELKRIAEKYDVLFIADEVMTGWGRTGSLFACEKAGIFPDILCTSKGLTGGILPLAATLCSEKIFDAHFSTDRRKTFFHSSSYTANPIACSAALANLEIWKTEPVYDRIQTLEKMQKKYLEQFQSDSRFSNIRQMGTITAMDLTANTAGYLSEIGPKLRSFFRKKNVLLRPLGNVIYVMPPYCVTEEDLTNIYQAIANAANEIISDKK